jgi:hypothetical protein
MSATPPRGMFAPVPHGLRATAVWSATPGVFSIAAVAMGALTLPYCLLALKRRDTLPLMLWVGGFAAAFVAEPLLGHLGHLWWPRDYPGPSFTAFGARIPGMIPPVYAFYLGMLGYVGYRLMQRGLTTRQVWALWGALVGTDLALQIVAVNLKAYKYYGQRPFHLAGLPLVGPVKNGTAYLLIGFLVWLLAPRLRGANRALFMLVPLTGYLAGAIVTAWPWYLAVNSRAPQAVAWLISALTFVLAFIVVRGIASVLAAAPQRDPQQRRSVLSDANEGARVPAAAIASDS